MTGVLLLCVIQSFPLQSAVKQVLHWIFVHPASDHLAIHKRRKHGGLQEPRQEVQVCLRLHREEGTLKHKKYQLMEIEIFITLKGIKYFRKHIYIIIISIIIVVLLNQKIFVSHSSTLSKLEVPSRLFNQESKSRALWMMNSSYLLNTAAKRPANTSLS